MKYFLFLFIISSGYITYLGAMQQNPQSSLQQTYQAWQYAQAEAFKQARAFEELLRVSQANPQRQAQAYAALQQANFRQAQAFEAWQHAYARQQASQTTGTQTTGAQRTEREASAPSAQIVPGMKKLVLHEGKVVYAPITVGEWQAMKKEREEFARKRARGGEWE